MTSTNSARTELRKAMKIVDEAIPPLNADQYDALVGCIKRALKHVTTTGKKKGEAWRHKLNEGFAKKRVAGRI